MPLAAESGDPEDFEAGRGEGAAHFAGGRPARQPRAGTRMPGERPDQRRLPHRGVSRRRETIEIERVGSQCQPRHHPGGLSERKGQGDSTALEAQPMQAGQGKGPLAQQPGGCTAPGLERV